MKIDPIGSPETSVSKHLTPRNNPEHGRIQFNRDGSPQSRRFEISRQISKETQISYFIKIRPMGAELFHDDGQTDTMKLTAVFRKLLRCLMKQKKYILHLVGCCNRLVMQQDAYAVIQISYEYIIWVVTPHCSLLSRYQGFGAIK